MTSVTHKTGSSDAYGSPTTTIAYDGCGSTISSGIREWDSSYSGFTARGNPDTITGPSGTTIYCRDPYGNITTASVNGRGSSVSTTSATNYLDGLGRPISVQTGNSSGTQNVAESVYGSCGCSPLGKLMQQAVPHAPGATPTYTTYTYDGIGRTLSVVAPDGASTTTYVYQGNTVKVTDPARKWKKFTMDVLGNLMQVTEPNPAGGADYVTTYTYDLLLGHLTGVSMTRGTTTQTRSFTYNGTFLTSATNPENGIAR